MSILVRGGLLVTQDEKRRTFQGEVLIEDHRIVQVGETEASADQEVDATGCIVLPGLVNSYTRLAHSLLGPPRSETRDSLQERMDALKEQATRRDVEMAAALTAAEMVLQGTTSFLDLFPWEEEVARAVTQVGCRGYLSQEVGSEAGLKGCQQFLRRVRGWERVVPLIGMSGVGNLDLLVQCKELAEKAGTRWCVPVAERRGDVYAFQKRSGARPVEWLEKSDLLSDQLIALHAVWLTLNEIRALARTGTKVVHCPLSNMVTGAGGVASMPEMLGEGVNVSLGTDSPFLVGTLDMFQHMRACGSLHRGQRWDPAAAPPQLLLDMCTREAARVLGLEGGALEKGKAADVITLRPRIHVSVTSQPAEVLSSLVHMSAGMEVQDVVVDGRLIVEGGVLQTVDLEELNERVASLRRELFT